MAYLPPILLCASSTYQEGTPLFIPSERNLARFLRQMESKDLRFRPSTFSIYFWDGELGDAALGSLSWFDGSSRRCGLLLRSFRGRWALLLRLLRRRRCCTRGCRCGRLGSS